MNIAAWLLILLVVVVLVGPFLALKAVSKYRARGRARNPEPGRPDS